MLSRQCSGFIYITFDSCRKLCRRPSPICDIFKFRIKATEKNPKKRGVHMIKKQCRVVNIKTIYACI